jgi:dinuclear metal center YbgI/SA1388 family protein
MPKVADIINVIDKIAPWRLAEDWDNVGLHYGHPDWPVSKILVCLDPTAKAVEVAADAGADMLVTHHPLIFKPIKTINVSTPAGSAIDLAARRRISILCAHTNLDAAAGGINDVLAEKIGLKVTGPLSHIQEAQRYKVVFFAPPSDADRIFHALSESSAGRIGKYTGCSFSHPGIGRFIPDADAKPHTGRPGIPASTDELRIEVSAGAQDLHDVINRVLSCHSYETPAYDIYPLHRETSRQGIGRIGEFEQEQTLEETARYIKQALSLKTVKIAGPPGLKVKKAAVCSGGGAGMAGHFLASDAQVYVSGDLNHHIALDITAKNRGLIDIGHFASENIIVPVLCTLIEKELKNASMIINVMPWTGETDPFMHI